MAFHVMHTDDGLAERKAQTVGDTGADEQCARQPRSLRIGDAVEIDQSATRRLNHAFDQRYEAPNVVARCEFGHDPAVGFMHRHLRVQLVRQQPLGGVVDGNPGLVAGGFDAEHPHDRASADIKRLSITPLARMTVDC